MPENTFCHLCGRRVVGVYQTFIHEDWRSSQPLFVCSDCLEKKPRCKICSLPMALPSPNCLCVTCNASKKYCLACGGYVGEQAFTFDQREPYCRDCVETKKRCDICNAPLTKQVWHLTDGRSICDYCHSKAIYSPTDADEAYTEIKMIAVHELGIQLNIPTGLVLLEHYQFVEFIRDQIEKMHSNHPQKNQLDPSKTLGLYARRGIRRAIYIQKGLPLSVFSQVAAHELGHAWQKENCPIVTDEMVIEGFAEWVSYRILGFLGYHSAQKRMRSRQDIYGLGLAWALGIEKKEGICGVLEACRKAS
jgi:hypothetical protein